MTVRHVWLIETKMPDGTWYRWSVHGWRGGAWLEMQRARERYPNNVFRCKRYMLVPA